MVFSNLKKCDFTNKQFHFLVQNGDRKIRTVCGGFMTCLQILLSVFAIFYTYLYLMYEYKENISLSPLFEPYDKTQLRYDGYVYNKIYLDLITPNQTIRETELFFKYFRIVYKVTTIKERVYHDNITILGDTYSSKSEVTLSNKDFSYPKEDKFPSIEISSCYNLLIKQSNILNPEMLKNCSTNLTEFYDDSSDDFDKNAYWTLTLDTRLFEDITRKQYQKTFFLQFKPFESLKDEYNLNYIPVETYNEYRVIRLNSYNSQESITLSAKIEDLVKVNALKSNFGYNANVKLLAETAYPYKIVCERKYITFTEALSSLGGFLKIISYIRYLYFFEGYDYDKFHFDLLNMNKRYERKKIGKEKAGKNSADFNYEVKETDHGADEIDRQAKQIEIKNFEVPKTPKEEENNVYLKDKMETQKPKARYSLNKTDNDCLSCLIPISHSKEDNNHHANTLNDYNFGIWQWLLMQISICKCCRLHEKKNRFYKYLNKSLNIENIMRNVGKKDDLSFKILSK